MVAESLFEKWLWAIAPVKKGGARRTEGAYSQESVTEVQQRLGRLIAVCKVIRGRGTFLPFRRTLR